MSYSKTFHSSVSGSKTVEVGPSESSRSITISYEHPFDVVIDVDTTPFESSIIKCNSNVSNLTNAITTAETAQVKSVKDSSTKISDSLLQGFFKFISSDLSQQISELMSKSQSLLVELTEQKKSCENIKSQMDRDYERITRRYSDLFSNLDKEMSNRIHSLCMPIFKVAGSASETLQQAVNNELLGIASVASMEMSNLETVLKCSSIKKNMGALISIIDEYIKNSYLLRQSVDDMLNNRKGGTYNYIPVAYVESAISEKGIDRSVFIPSDDNVNWGDKMERTIESSFQNRAVKWEDIDGHDTERIKNYFNDELSRSGVSPRVAQTINKLMEKNRIKTNKL